MTGIILYSISLLDDWYYSLFYIKLLDDWYYSLFYFF